MPRSLNGNVVLPLSKSINNRLQIMNYVLGIKSPLEISKANDAQVLNEILENFPSKTDIDVKDAGTVARFMLALCAATPNRTFKIIGTDRMHQRPINQLVDALSQLGAQIEYLAIENQLPVLIHGKKLNGQTLAIENLNSSQFLSALILISPLIEGKLRLRVDPNQVSKPYVEMTIHLMKQMGVLISKTPEIISIENDLKRTDVNLNNLNEPDWSAAIYFLLIKALRESDSVSISGLNAQSVQGDSQVKELFKQLGYHLHFHINKMEITKRTLISKRLEYNLIDKPDLAQAIACFCASQKIPFKLTGLKTLRHKETDRIDALQKEFSKLGISGTFDTDCIEVINYPAENFKTCMLSTHQDHRMAMSLFFFMLQNPQIQIENPEVVSKSFPSFWTELEKLGFRFELNTL